MDRHSGHLPGHLFGANLPVKGRNAFLCSGVWASIGHSVAAALGASFGSSRRPLVICGDGGFHMTAQTLSTLVHYGRNPVILLIANGIYGYEQFLVDSSFFSSPTKPPRPMWFSINGTSSNSRMGLACNSRRQSTPQRPSILHLPPRRQSTHRRLSSRR
jgi:thiamine pyrophosphate-dependent enzyme